MCFRKFVLIWFLLMLDVSSEGRKIELREITDFWAGRKVFIYFLKVKLMGEAKHNKQGVYSLVAKNVALLRDHYGYSQRDLAKKINRAQGTVTQIERGKAITLPNLETIAMVFGVRPSALIELKLEQTVRNAVEEVLRPYKVV